MPCVSMGGLQGTGSPSQYLPMGWIVSLLPLVLIPTGGFSVISPQTAGVLKSGTASRAAGVGRARDSGLGGGRSRSGVTQLDAWGCHQLRDAGFQKSQDIFYCSLIRLFHMNCGNYFMYARHWSYNKCSSIPGTPSGSKHC